MHLHISPLRFSLNLNLSMQAPNWVMCSTINRALFPVGIMRGNLNQLQCFIWSIIEMRFFVFVAGPGLSPRVTCILKDGCFGLYETLHSPAQWLDWVLATCQKDLIGISIDVFWTMMAALETLPSESKTYE